MKNGKPLKTNVGGSHVVDSGAKKKAASKKKVSKKTGSNDNDEKGKDNVS